MGLGKRYHNQCSFLASISSGQPKIVYFYSLSKKIGSKYPKNILFMFENRSTAHNITFRTITVLVLPPSESCNKRVSFESRYGTCAFAADETRDSITLPRAVRDMLILIPSFICSPVAPVLDCRSDPARSTKFSFPTLHVALRSDGVQRVDELQRTYQSEISLTGFEPPLEAGCL